MKTSKILYKIVAVVLSVVFVLVGLFIFSGTNESVKVQKGEGQVLTMYKNPNCGCCTNYASVLRKEGYSVEVVKTNNMNSIKSERGISRDISSCHTIVSNDYFIEGHVPIAAVDKLFTENPDLNGIVLPGMPAGSPGMGGMKQGDFRVFSMDGSEKKLFYKT